MNAHPLLISDQLSLLTCVCSGRTSEPRPEKIPCDLWWPQRSTTFLARPLVADVFSAFFRQTEKNPDEQRMCANGDMNMEPGGGGGARILWSASPQLPRRRARSLAPS